MTVATSFIREVFLNVINTETYDEKIMTRDNQRGLLASVVSRMTPTCLYMMIVPSYKWDLTIKLTVGATPDLVDILTEVPSHVSDLGIRPVDDPSLTSPSSLLH
ncbi:hypothetical protein HAX54_028273 [Datura stramonium]|uniref:Uncharacterized protein n=1 Tax=Datura stramonium TaxID=4076 RepID=A0ABS8S9H6_DATST|nr:hypothetical protein [Datura stramonium]